MKPLPPFHLAIPVNDINTTRHFYQDILGCEVGREDTLWIDFNFFGHQVSAHVKPEATGLAKTNQVDSESVPVRHLGLILEWDVWNQLVDSLNNADIEFLIKPTIRFEGQPGEQATCFIQDPSGNALEFKSFRDMSMLFSTG